jgi:hypothetical protein
VNSTPMRTVHCASQQFKGHPMDGNDTQENPWISEAWHLRILNWQLLRGFGQSLPAGLTMSTPFIGYVILYHEKIKDLLGGLGGLLDEQAPIDQCGPWFDFTMRLNLIYFGLLLLGIGTIFYRIYAPDPVKSARNISDYVVKTVDHVTARNLRSMFVIIRSRRPEVADSLVQLAPWLERTVSLKTASDTLKRSDDGQITIDVLRSYHFSMNRHSSRMAVYMTLFFYVLGFLLLAIPGVAFTSRVLCVVGTDIGWL